MNGSTGPAFEHTRVLTLDEAAREAARRRAPLRAHGIVDGHSPDGTRVLLFRMCFDAGEPKPRVYVTDTSGSYRTFVTGGFGPDWNPLAPSWRGCR